MKQKTSKLLDDFKFKDKLDDKIICLVGASGSGKTTIAKILESEGFNIIKSYTTRKPREENKWGHTFIDEVRDINKKTIGFVENGMYKNRPRIAHFNNYEKDEHYFATEEQYKDKGISIYIVDPKGAEQVKENAKDAEVVTIFLMADKKTRHKRLHHRAGSERIGLITIGFDENAILEVNGRIEKDKEIFKTCKCDYVVDANRDLEEVLADIVEIMGRQPMNARRITDSELKRVFMAYVEDASEVNCITIPFDCKPIADLHNGYIPVKDTRSALRAIASGSVSLEKWWLRDGRLYIDKVKLSKPTGGNK